MFKNFFCTLSFIELQNRVFLNSIIPIDVISRKKLESDNLAHLESGMGSEDNSSQDENILNTENDNEEEEEKLLPPETQTLSCISQSKDQKYVVHFILLRYTLDILYYLSEM